MEISIETPQKRFDEHLKLENNNRILFSGKFGTGKSHFLREYFKQNADKYNLFWISPVDYVVGANQDIFEWIKIDIAKELLKKYLIIEDEEKFSKGLMLSTYLYNSTGNIVANLIERVSKQAEKHTEVDISKELKQVLDNYAAFEKGIEEETKSPYKKLADHIDKHTQIKGSIYEDDLVTQIIRSSVEIVAKITKKECVIVIDDLDRLDPDHIFRILNILSAHNNHFDSNKFGFQRVIAVCDIENIKHLFEYRYGPNSDFEGYIEKYYTYVPFDFSILSAIIAFCEGQPILSQNLDEDGKAVLITILNSFFELDLLKMRNLKKNYDIRFSKVLPATHLHSNLQKYYDQDYQLSDLFIINPLMEVNYELYSFLKVIYILSITFGGIENLKKAIEILMKKNRSVGTKNSITIIKSMAILSHIARKELTNEDSAFNTKMHSTNDVDILRPQINFLSFTTEIPIVWSTLNRYKNGEYFQLSDSNSFWHRINQNANNGNVGWNLLGNEILLIIKFIKHKGFFENI
ncbi:hypothetical protein CJD36_013240 [Flavipsychrobacter stenotrophus]|uniref:KAP NTPase domain-containing protein n=1 Tax=Flavipsychrobacter stenotrophus TaxID=2077091 RepID=A0A2S7SVI2_9BACT|nr:P-loop NTPase fold protein [Flavipsychrobacter stenotrophus]PQJ10929.1 hypothetical protein CJD36_013240 [Flavipsychrobacter stenotrophus]